MSILPLEWVLIVKYNKSAHRAIYGRLPGTTYSKDYIQLYKGEFVEEISDLFGLNAGIQDKVDVVYKWPGGEVGGLIQLVSADRPHLAWRTNDAPQAWKMSLSPGPPAVQTIFGNPGHKDSDSADAEFDAIFDRGDGQPYLLVAKMKGEDAALHVRAYIANPSPTFEFASTSLLPSPVRSVIDSISGNRAGAWQRFSSDGVAPTNRIKELIESAASGPELDAFVSGLNSADASALREYLENPGTGLFFDTEKNHGAWLAAPPALSASQQKQLLDDLNSLSGPPPTPTDPLGPDESEGEEDAEGEGDFLERIENEDYAVSDLLVSAKSRGSAQRAFSKKVKQNYGYRCAITGITEKSFLVGAHIVPWGADESIRLDPTNGICLSVLVDKAFEFGFIEVDDDLKVRVISERFSDKTLLKELMNYDGATLYIPADYSPKREYLERRRAMNKEKKA